MRVVHAGFLAGVLVSGCATVPSGPSVMVLPGSGKNLETFQVDEIACRQWAGQQIGAGGYDGQRGYDMTYMQCMYAKGHRIPVSRGSLPGYTSSPPAEERSAPATPEPPAGAPPPSPPR
jgi:hypothetical protein